MRRSAGALRDAVGFPVADLAGFLIGRWRIERRIVDHLSGAGAEGRLVGAAIVSTVAGGLHYDESGILTLGGYVGEARRSQRFILDGPAVADVQFADGRPFHRVDLSCGAADVFHACPPDGYWGRYDVAGRDDWTLRWRIEGARKRSTIETRYAREG